jgi:hypothetical protein
MAVLSETEFVWPDKRGTSALCKRTIQHLLEMVGGDPEHWRYYAVLDPDTGDEVSWIQPNTAYKLFMRYPDTVMFRWLYECADPEDPQTIERALEIANLDFLEIPPERYFVARSRCGRPLSQSTLDGLLHTGRTYFLIAR